MQRLDPVRKTSMQGTSLHQTCLEYSYEGISHLSSGSPTELLDIYEYNYVLTKSFINKLLQSIF